MHDSAFEQFRLREMTRRHFFRDCGVGLGAMALGSLLDEGKSARADIQPAGFNPGSRGLHHEPKAKAVIFLFMAGGPSQHDLFDPKEFIRQKHGQHIDSPLRKEVTQVGTEKFLALAEAAPVKPRGESGTLISDLICQIENYL